MVKRLKVGFYVLVLFMCVCQSFAAAEEGLVLKDKVRMTVIDAQIAVDLNRDGVIEFERLDEATQTYVSADKTSRDRPFRFWVNDDYDVVNDAGNVNLDEKNCNNLNITEPFQTCEQDDYIAINFDRSANKNNSNSVIESTRDLEDFERIAIKISPWDSERNIFNPRSNSLRVYLTSENEFSLNIFQGLWEYNRNDTKILKEINERRTTRSYLTDPVVAKKQTNSELYIGRMIGGLNRSGTSLELPSSIFDENGIARLIFEGVDPCARFGQACSLELTVENAQGEVLVKKDLFLDVDRVTEFYDNYTAGNWWHGPDDDFVGNDRSDYRGIKPESGDVFIPDDISLERTERLSGKHLHVADTQEEQQILEQDYIFFVHGWRMRPRERKDFANTTFKRLYWSGYKGKFGFLSWPTGWLWKPSHLPINYQVFVTLISDLQNYGRSEAVARRVGWKLAHTLREIRARQTNVYLMAHSMGNVVVSEALRKYSGLNIKHYVPMQAATAANAYNVSMTNVQYSRETAEELTESGNARTFNEVWVILNSLPILLNEFEFFTEYKHFPSDRYKIGLLEQNPENSQRFNFSSGYNENLNVHEPILEAENFAPHYKGLRSKVSRITNYYNPLDSALGLGYLANQVTKPDLGLNFSAPRSIGEYLLERGPDGPRISDPIGNKISFFERAGKVLKKVLKKIRFLRPNESPQWVFNRVVRKDGQECPFENEDEPSLTTVFEDCNEFIEVFEVDATNSEQRDIFYEIESPTSFSQPDILASIVPTRSVALGRSRTTQSDPIAIAGGVSEINGALMLNDGPLGNFSFTDSNQDHSAQFLSDFATRQCFWASLLVTYEIIEVGTIEAICEN